MPTKSVRWRKGWVALAGLLAVVVLGAVAARGDVAYETKGVKFFEGHPADTDMNWRLVMSEAIAYLAGWQQGSNPLSYAIRAAYLWQNGEAYHYISGEAPPMCWVLAPPV